MNKKLLFIITLLFLILNINLILAAPTYNLTGMVNHWRLDTNVIDDVSGLNPTEYFLTYNSTGIYNYSANFNGTAYYSFGTNQFEVPTGTFNLWFKKNLINNAGITQWLFDNRAVKCYLNGDTELNCAIFDGATKTVSIINNTLLNNTNWHMLTFAYLQSNLLKIYVDGVQKGNVSIGTVSTTYTVNTNFGSAYTPSDYFKGQIDDVLFWNRQISDTEILTLYNSYLIPPNTLYNLSTDLSTTDLNDWMTTGNIYALEHNVNDSKIYVGLSLGRFGTYNPLTNIASDLSGTDTGNWMPSSLAIYSIKHSPKNNKIYIAGENGIFGVYDPVTNVSTGLYTTDVGNWMGTTNINSLSYDPANNQIYLFMDTGRFGMYNPLDNITYDYSTYDTDDWVKSSLFLSSVFNINNNKTYVGLSGGKFGVYDPTILSDLSTSDTGDWIGTDVIKSLTHDSINNKIYIGASGGKFGVYDPITNITTDLSTTDTGNWFGTGTYNIESLSFNKNNSLIYIGLSSGTFGVYNPITNVASDLSTSDTGNWFGTSTMDSLVYNSNNSYVYLATNAKFGVYGQEPKTINLTSALITPNPAYDENNLTAVCLTNASTTRFEIFSLQYNLWRNRTGTILNYTNGTYTNSPNWTAPSLTIAEVDSSQTQIGDMWYLSCSPISGFNSTTPLTSSLPAIENRSLPIITLNSNNGFNESNLSIITSYLRNLTLNVTIDDYNITNISININCTTNGTIFNWSQNGATNKVFNYTNTVNLTGTKPQTCEATIYVLDSDLVLNNITKKYTFYIGGYLNLSSLNLGNNNATTISGYTINVTSTDSKLISGTTGYYDNLTSGIYSIVMSHPDYLSMRYIVNIENQTQSLVYSTAEAVLYVTPINTKTGLPLTNQTTNVTNLLNNKSYQLFAGNTTTVEFYLNSSNYSVRTTVPNYYNSTINVTLSKKQNLTLYPNMQFLALFLFTDERTNSAFNISSADRIEFLMKCPNDINYQLLVTNSTQSIPVPCNFSSFRVLVEYGTTSYYRNFLYTPDDIFNITIYLIDLSNTDAIYTEFFLDDLLNQYDNPALTIKRIIGGNTVVITADYTDAEDKIGTYLVKNFEYILEISSDNNPVQVMGNYISAVGGSKTLRLYTISSSLEPTNFGSTVSYIQGELYNNVTNESIIYATYRDTENATNSVSFLVWKDSYKNAEGVYTGTLLHNTTVLNPSYHTFIFNQTAYINSSLFSELVINHPDAIGVIKTKAYHPVTAITLGIFQHLRPNTAKWFFTLLLSVIAIMATIKSANLLSIVLNVEIFLMLLL